MYKRVLFIFVYKEVSGRVFTSIIEINVISLSYVRRYSHKTTMHVVMLLKIEVTLTKYRTIIRCKGLHIYLSLVLLHP